MILKSFIVLFVTINLRAEGREYTYDDLAGGWLKLYDKTPWNEASVKCDSEDAVLAAPVNSQIRDAIRAYVNRELNHDATIFTGIHADFDTGDYFSVEGVPLTKMPVLVQSSASVDFTSSETCVEWMTSKDEVAVMKCTEEKPFVCFKKRKTLVVAGCGTKDPEYAYNVQSGSCYKFHRKGQTWMKAYKMCKKEGGYLAVINSPLEHKVLREVFDKNPSETLIISADALRDYAFIGFRDWKNGEPWKTVTGQSLEDAGFNVWASGEPNNGHNNEYCGTLYRPGYLNDADCNYQFAFICEKNPEILYN